MSLFLSLSEVIETFRAFQGRSTAVAADDDEDNDFTKILLEKKSKQTWTSSTESSFTRMPDSESDNRRLVLVLASSKYRAIFAQAETLKAFKSEDPPIPLTLTSEPHVGLVKMYPEPRMADIYSYVDLCFGPAEEAIKITYDGRYLTNTCGRVFDVAMGQFCVGNHLNIVSDTTEERGGTRSEIYKNRLFVVNADGSISPEKAQHLALGHADGVFAKRDQDRELLRLFTDEFTFFGLCNFASMPVTFFLAFHGFTLYLYAFIFAKFCLSALFQWLLMSVFKRWVRSKNLETMKHLQDRLNEVKEKRQSGVIAVSTNAFKWGINVLEFVDPDLDAMTAGNSFAMLKAAQTQMFAKTWEHIPGMSWLTRTIGLPGILTLNITLATLCQLWKFAANVQHLRNMSKNFPGCYENKGENARFWFLHILVMSSDVAGMLVVMDTCDELRDAEVGGMKGERGEGFISKAVAETVPSAWFQISYLALAFDDMTWCVRITTICSIGTSFLAAFAQLANMLSIHWRALIDKSKCEWHYNEKRFGTIVVMLGFTVMTARMAGVFTCPSHVFQMSEVHCESYAS